MCWGGEADTAPLVLGLRRQVVDLLLGPGEAMGPAPAGAPAWWTWASGAPGQGCALFSQRPPVLSSPQCAVLFPGGNWIPAAGGGVGAGGHVWEGVCGHSSLPPAPASPTCPSFSLLPTDPPLGLFPPSQCLHRPTQIHTRSVTGLDLPPRTVKTG